MAELQNTLPPGWDCKLDKLSGKHYYVNHFTKTTTWEDPRLRHRQFPNASRHLSNVAGEYIPLQHGSPEFKRNYVYPSQSPPIHAFQMNSKAVQIQDMRPATRSPLTLKSAKIKDSSLTVINAYNSTDSDDSVTKIGSMFPTVSETHIKLLLNKYLNREALVISALQVEKYPITTPGPFSTPPPQRNIHVNANGVTSNAGSPILRGLAAFQGFRNSPKPHSSPKLKLRYMKSIFPEADETLIHEVLQNNENNIQKSSDVLKDMGYNKKDTVKINIQKTEAASAEDAQPSNSTASVEAIIPPVLTNESKQQLKEKLQKQYKDVAEHLISIALESVHFDENRASQILNIMKQENSEHENNSRKAKNIEDQPKTEVDSVPSTSQVTTQIPISQSRQSIKSLLKEEKKVEVGGFSRTINTVNYCKSKLLRNTTGHNPDLSKGPNEKLLLENYVQWQGCNNNLQKGPQGLAKGSNKNLLANKIYKSCGPKVDLHKGPVYGLAKGSIYNQALESRVK